MDIEFQGYRKKTKEEIDFLWKNAIFTFDTNSLLNIYRYSDTTRKDISEIINKIEDRIFLTHQVAFEFNKNRFENINNIIKSKNEFLKNLDTINIQISKNSEQILSNYLTDKFAVLLDEIRTEIDSKIEFFNKLFDNDIIFALINLLFSNKILSEIEEEKIAQLKKIGEIRYGPARQFHGKRFRTQTLAVADVAKRRRHVLRHPLARLGCGIAVDHEGVYVAPW